MPRYKITEHLTGMEKNIDKLTIDAKMNLDEAWEKYNKV